MSSRPAPRITPSLLVAFLALLIACSGTAYAAGKAKGDAIIKPASLSGNRLKPDTVTGRQVKESTLGTVPQAARAAQAQRVASVTSIPLEVDNGWGPTTGVGAAAPSYGIDAQGWVRLEGAVQRENSSDVVVAILPVGYRPASTVYLPVAMANNKAGTISITPQGLVALLDDTVIYVSLEGLTFRAAGR